MNSDLQLKFLREIFPRFRDEFNFPEEKDSSIQDYDFFLRNGCFEAGDAEVLHSMIRYFKPKKIVEIGSGFSTYISARACLLNKEKDGVKTKLIAIEPFPNDTIKQGFPGLSELIKTPLEQIDLDLFRSMEANDIVFIDSTHVLKIGGDVKYEYLEIIPRLKKGVIVHSHDIFLPAEYHRRWVVENHWFWTEQYLLQAFLAFNNAFEILWAGQYMARKYFNELIPVFPSYQNTQLKTAETNQSIGSGSLWMRRKSD
jgi:predicted O-methyltransferase YrrM